MRSIYQKAQLVRSGSMAWKNALVGSPTSCSELRMCGPAGADQFADPVRLEGFRALQALFDHEYRRCIWVIQERIVAKDILVHCRGCKIKRSDLKDIQTLLWMHHRPELINQPKLDSTIVSILLTHGPKSINKPPKESPTNMARSP